MNSKFLHGLFVAFITILSQQIFSSGHLPLNGLGWETLLITVSGSLLIWVSQSIILPTTSLIGGVNWRDLVKGGLVALGNLLSGWVATQLPGAVLNWNNLLASAGTVLVMYFVSQFAMAQKTTT